MTKPPIPSKPETVRVTVPVTLEVQEAFQRLASASGMSTGRAMGEFLSDMIESIDYLAQTVQRAREAPKTVARELHAYALGLSDETGEFMRQITAKGVADRVAMGMRKRPLSGPVSQTPPPSNTGGKVPPVNPRSTGPKA
jgi:hypothetical protein